MSSKISGWVLFAVITGLYIYMVVAAVGNLISFPTTAEALGYSVSPFGWVRIWFSIGLPVLAYVIALFVGRRRGGAAKLLVLATGLAVAAALQLEIELVISSLHYFN